ncbi:hypothetical protein SK128_007309 [Halocaridina rubra]|uniref:Uncharacterized protein n=1 Tax=Halocaridina rubra TaxID=373956 RepID=A0AAN8XEL5_HALRR
MAYRQVPYFGHQEYCFSFDNKCHCSSSEPFRLPPETPPVSEPSISIEHLFSCNCAFGERGDFYQGSQSSRSSYQLLGHERECYAYDNRCHCNSSKSFLLPPEVPWCTDGWNKTQEPILTTTVSSNEVNSLHFSSPADIRSNSYSRDESSHFTSSQSVTSHTTKENDLSDLPPSYDSLFPQKTLKE